MQKNYLIKLKFKNMKKILYLFILAPYAPHISEELYHHLNSLPLGEGRPQFSILNATYPKLEEKYLIESTKEYPVSINGKLRTTIKIELSASSEQVQEKVLANEVVKKWIENKPLQKFIFVKGKMVNLVI